MAKKFSRRLITRYVIPPILTIGASTFILIEANWLHQQETQTGGSHLSSGITSTTTNPPNLSGLKHHPVKQTGTSQSNTSKHSQTPNQSSHTNTGSSTPPAKQTDHSSSNTPTADVGFTPVSGGTLKNAPDPVKLNLTEALSSLVVQYGASPQTTFDVTSMASQYGVNVSLNLPKGITANQILLLPLQSGVIWAIVPPTTDSANGGVSESSTPTTLYYTQYGGGAKPSDVTLSLSAPTLGKIPTHVSSTDITTSWYHVPTSTSSSALAPADTTNTTSAFVVQPPSSSSAATTNQSPTNQTAPAQNTQPSGSANQSASNGQTSSTGSSANTTPTATAGAVQFHTVSDSTSASGTNLFIRGLYRVDGGVVILLRTQQASQSGEWAYYWNESTKSLKPVCSITTSVSDFGWIAVGPHTVYWGQRNLIPPQNTYYKGAQYMMTLATGQVRSIRIGNWTSEAVAGQDINSYQSDPDQADDELYFRVHDSPVWQEFLPSPAH